MAITFDYVNSYVGATAADVTPLTIQTLLNAIRAQEASEQGITYPAICAAAGKDDLGGGVSVGLTLSLLNAWKLNFTGSGYQATVTGGNLASALSKVVNNPNIQVLFNSSAAGTLTTITSGSGLSSDQATKLDEVHKVHGLNAAAPLVVAPAQRSVGGITQTIVTDGTGATTVTRQ